MDNNYKILVVDDDLLICEFIKNALEDEGFRVTAVNNGQKALDIYKECQADLIVLDIKMPGMDGYQVLEKLRQESAIPVIILTGNRDTDSLVRMLELGANDYLAKPFRAAELAARIRAKIRRANFPRNQPLSD